MTQDPKKPAPDSDPALEKDLDAMGAIEREMLKSAQAPAIVPGLDSVESTLRAAMAKSDGERRANGAATRLPRLIFIAAAAAVLLLVAWWFHKTGPSEVPNQRLGGTFRIVDPDPSKDPFERVEWIYPNALGVTFRIRVLDETEQEIFSQPGIREQSFNFPTEKTILWPAHIVIEVVALDPSGGAESSVRSSRSRH